MEVKFNEGTPQRPSGERIIDASIVPIDLKRYTGQIKNEVSWKDSDRNAITVFKTDVITIVLVALHEGAEIIKNEVDSIVNVHLLEGELKVTTELQFVELNDGQMVVIHEGISHTVKAMKESVLLLTVTKSGLDQGTKSI